MPALSNLKEVARVLGEFAKTVPTIGYKIAADDSQVSLGALFEDTVARYPDNTMLLFEGRQWSYQEFNQQVNQLAHFFRQQGIERGDCVALFMENRAEFLMCMLALVKLGAIASLINNSL